MDLYYNWYGIVRYVVIALVVFRVMMLSYYCIRFEAKVTTVYFKVSLRSAYLYNVSLKRDMYRAIGFYKLNPFQNLFVWWRCPRSFRQNTESIV